MSRWVCIFVLVLSFSAGCKPTVQNETPSAKELLRNPNNLGFSYGGFREKTREEAPTVEQVTEDLRLLNAMGVRLLRTYNSQIFPHAERVLEAIAVLKKEDKQFEMYVMLGAWIECEGAFTDTRNHAKENLQQNEAEIEKAIQLQALFPDIVKIIAVGNESMVHWAETYSVTPIIVLKYVRQLQELKQAGKMDSSVWITSSDNFASWGGGSAEYHNSDLLRLIQEVDYISMHTYPFHDTHYNSTFWKKDLVDTVQTNTERSIAAMNRAVKYAKSQYFGVKQFIDSLGIQKDIHLGETGWSTSSHSFYGPDGSRAADEYKQKLYYDAMRSWTSEEGISCFYFEAFDEQWKDLKDERASENHFGLFNLKSEAKYALWNLVDQGVFKGLNRDRKTITKTFNGNETELLQLVQGPPFKEKDTLN
jgi:exo-beta-1,3-glucanase (GH17 family)